MNLQAWEATIQQIADEANQEPRNWVKTKILIAWRAKLEKDSASLRPSEIDEIVRAVRKRFTVAS